MMDNPDPVSRVAPPSRIIPRIIAQTVNSQTATARRAGAAAVSAFTWMDRGGD